MMSKELLKVLQGQVGIIANYSNLLQEQFNYIIELKDEIELLQGTIENLKVSF